MAEAVAGERIRGSWWSYPKGYASYAATRAAADSADVLVCRLIQGKIAFVHRDLWSALVLCANRFPRELLAQVHQRHTESGRHEDTTVSLPRRVAVEVRKARQRLSEEEALQHLWEWAR